jgi:hypothetical protein
MAIIFSCLGGAAFIYCCLGGADIISAPYFLEKSKLLFNEFQAPANRPPCFCGAAF